MRLRPLLSSLAARSGQLGSVDYLEYFLTGPYVGTKVPCLFLVFPPGVQNPGVDLESDQLYGAVLAYEYRVCGFDTKIYITDDDGGERTVLAVSAVRPRIAARVAENLVHRGARLVLMTVRSEHAPAKEAMQLPAGRRKKSMSWTSRERQTRRYLTLQSTYDETLATLGKHTRRNLRSFRRRVESELQAVFLPLVTIPTEEFVTLNRSCSYPVPDRIAVWRHETAAQLEGGFIMGVRSADGRWLSLLGGRRHHGTTEVAWQMNLEDHDELSLGTVMRSYLIEHEVGLGMNRLFFEGGTPHSMQSAFTSDTVVDILVSGRSVPAAFLRRHAPRLLPPKNILSEMLRDGELTWVPERAN